VKYCTLFRSKLPYLSLSLLAILQFSPPPPAQAQAIPYARTFLRSKEDVEAALRGLQAYAGQKLPIVDGFVAMGEQPLDRYEHAFYQFSIDLVPNGTDSTVVKLSAKITAWYADPDPSKAGYQVLPSTGRLELDLLDRLGEEFGAKPSIHVPRTTLQAPRPKIDSAGNPLPEGPSSLVAASNSAAGASPGTAPSAASANELAALKSKREIEQKHMLELKSEL
jgi:hypothetical protein